MPCPSEEFSGSENTNEHFQNWPGNVDITVDRFFRPNSRQALIWVAQQATRQGRKLHAVGSGWSFEDNMASDEWMVSLENLNAINTEVLDVSRGAYSALDPYWARRVSESGADSHLVHVEAGIRLFDLNNVLHSRGYAMRSLGGSQGQSLAGVISTSTHGGDLHEPPVCDFVKAIHLITHDGQELWIESSSQPLTQDTQFRSRLIPDHACTDIDIIRDDDLLHAVQVSVGRFGIIYAVVVEVRSWFNLIEWTTPDSWGNIAALLREGIDTSTGLRPLLDGLPRPDIATDFRDIALGEGHRPHVHYLEFLVNSRSDNGLFVRRRWESTSTDHTLATPGGGGGEFIDEFGVAGAVLQLAALTIRLTIPLVAAIPVYGVGRSLEMEARAAELDFMSTDLHINSSVAMVAAINALWACDEFGGFGPTVNEISHMVFNERDEIKRGRDGLRGVSWQVTSGLDGNPGSTKVNSVEVTFSTQDPNYIDFISFLMREGRNYRQSGYYAIRYSATSDALLSMHNFDTQHAVTIEVASLAGFAENARWMELVESHALELGGRMHWGQENHLQSWQVMRSYGTNLTRWRDQLLRVCGTSSTFSNPYTERRGLEARLIIRDVTHVRRAGGRITHLANPGQHWSPVPVEEFIDEYMSDHPLRVQREPFLPALGLMNYQVVAENPDIPPARIIVKHLLTTTPDDVRGNNLSALPSRPEHYSHQPPRELTRRQVTSVVRNSFYGVEYLNNDDEGWSIFDRIAFLEIRSGTVEYFVRDSETGTETLLQAKTFLGTFADGREENNLSSLPEDES